MSDEMKDAGENVRQHVHKILAQLRDVREQQREKPNPSGPDIAVEIDREEHTSSSISGGEGPTLTSIERPSVEAPVTSAA